MKRYWKAIDFPKRFFRLTALPVRSRWRVKARLMCMVSCGFTGRMDKFIGDKCDAQFHRKINGRSVPGLRRSIVVRKSVPVTFYLDDGLEADTIASEQRC